MDEEGFDEEEKKGIFFWENRIKYNGKKERKQARKTHKGRGMMNLES
jgi:predicted secreted hydrolase